jgi:hypothetical protein
LERIWKNERPKQILFYKHIHWYKDMNAFTGLGLIAAATSCAMLAIDYRLSQEEMTPKVHFQYGLMFGIILGTLANINY